MNFVKTIFTYFPTRTIIFVIFFFTLHSVLFAQLLPVINQNNPNNTSTLFQIQKTLNDYWSSQNVQHGFVLENGISKKVPNWKLYKRWEYYWEQRVNPQTGEFPQTNSTAEYEKYKASQAGLSKATKYDESWTNLGTNSTPGGYAGLGRINCVAFHPTDNNTFWVGSPSGGIWKTTNGGTSWTILNNNLSVIGVSDIIIPSDYATSNTIYIATGDRDGGSVWSMGGGQVADNASIGVMKSTNGGATWNSTGLTYTASQKKLVYRLLIHPTNNQILFAATSDGIFKTTNGGTSWTSKTANVWADMEFKPGDPTVMYASSLPYGSTYVNRSTDSGENWSFSSVATSGRRGELAVSANNSAVVYLLAANSGGGVDGVYKSTNSGTNWTKVNNNSVTQPGMLGYYTDGSGGSGGQGWYDWCIAVSPTDANTVFIGGITTWKSTDGGVNWTANTCWTSYYLYNISGVPVTHADKHSLVYQNSTTLFEGNDGGIYKTTNSGTSWTDLSNGLIISQIYRIGISQTSSTTVITGLQDNGSKLFSGGSWSDVKGGDGMECIVDYSNTNYMYATYVEGQISRSTNGGSSFSTDISANIPGGKPAGAWVTPYIIDPTNSATLYAGYDKIWKTTNRGNSWTSASQQLSASNLLRSLAIAPSNSSVLYTADQTAMWKTTDGGATNWSAITLPTTANTVTYIAVKNNDPNTVWIAYGGFDGNRVYQSTNGGSSWTNISTGLPNLPVMCIVQYKVATDRDVLFVGTDVGVFVKNGSNAWVTFSNGLPSVVVTELEVYYGGSVNKLRAGTYGRGLWETTIDVLLPVQLVSFVGSFEGNNVKLEWQTVSETNNYGFNVQRLNEASNNFETIGFVTGNGTTLEPHSYSYIDNHPGTSYRLEQIDNDGLKSYYGPIMLNPSSVVDNVPAVFALDQNYPNPFNPSTKISFSLANAGYTTLKVYNILGKEVATLYAGNASAGRLYTFTFDGKNLNNGLYFSKLVCGNRIGVMKMALVK
jgi:hypothetical protein